MDLYIYAWNTMDLYIYAYNNHRFYIHAYNNHRFRNTLDLYIHGLDVREPWI